jgi:hypothetical protein
MIYHDILWYSEKVVNPFKGISTPIIRISQHGMDDDKPYTIFWAYNECRSTLQLREESIEDGQMLRISWGTPRIILAIYPDT